MEYTVQNLEYAVSVFYNSEHNERAQAHQWLTTAQRCPEAWQFVWELLQPTKGTEVQFFAATTLHTKLLRCWLEVPPESHDALRDKIMQSVLGYAKGPKIVLNRLCISLAAFILQQGTADLATILRPLSCAENMTLLLEVLTVIPEEFNSMTMGSALRTKNRIILQQACPAILDDMLRCLQSGHSKDPPSEATIQLWCSAAECAARWLALPCEDDVLRELGSTTPLADRLPLCHALHNVVHCIYTHNEVISDSSLEACEAALGAVRAAGASPEAARCPNAALLLVSELAALAQPILARDNVPNSINEELLCAIATCAVALAECHSRCVVSAAQSGAGAASDGARHFLELLLASQAAPGYYPLHETRSQLVFLTWYTLQDEVLCISDDGEVSAVWRSLFSRLLTVLIQKCEAPSDDALSNDDKELLRCYRQDVADAVMYCYGVLGSQCWSIVEAAYRDATTDARREAALHVFLALGDSAPQQQAPEQLELMLRHAVDTAACTADLPLLTTALDCLGAYSWWLGGMSETPDGPVGTGALGRAGAGALGRAALGAAGAALGRAAPAAALALKKLTAECSELAAELASEIVQAAQQSECCKKDAWVRRLLLGAAGAALCAAPPPLAAELLASLAHSLHADLTQQASEPTVPNGSAEAAAALITALTTRTDLATELFRIILPALPPFSMHALLATPLFLILKQTISVLMDECLPMIEHIARLVLQAMEVHVCASGMDVVKLMVLMFGAQWADCSRLFHATISLAATSCASDASARSDVTEALFSTLQAITKKKLRYIDALEDLLPRLVALGCECIRLWEVGASRAACGWLSALAVDKPEALINNASDLTCTAVRCIGGATPRNQMEPLAELLLALNKAAWSRDGLARWLTDSLAETGFPTHHATLEHKNKFIANVLKEKTSKRRLLETVQEFSFVCRGLIATEYARQTLASRQLVS